MYYGRVCNRRNLSNSTIKNLNNFKICYLSIIFKNSKNKNLNNLLSMEK